jgi:hypothetical protein
MATFSHTPYFLSKLIVLAPHSDFPPRSESDFLLLVDRADDLLTSLGAPRRSLRVNFWPPESEFIEGGPFGRVLPSLEGVGEVFPLGNFAESFSFLDA